VSPFHVFVIVGTVLISTILISLPVFLGHVREVLYGSILSLVLVGSFLSISIPHRLSTDEKTIILGFEGKNATARTEALSWIKKHPSSSILSLYNIDYRICREEGCQK